MFNEETCKRCGACLTQCPFLETPKKKAVQEISRMIETRTSEEIVRDCAGCLYCDTICPTQSNPSGLRKEIKTGRNREEGVGSLVLISEEIPMNLMTAGLEFDTEEKVKNLKEYSNPPMSSEMFYIGCSPSYLSTDLAKTALLKGLPLLGGIKYCCGGYVYNLFGEEEAEIKGKQLRDEFHKLGIKKLITFCPGCHKMTSSVYPEIVDGYDIESQTIIEYLVEQYHKGELKFTKRINKRIAFHDPCPWRALDRKIYDAPRELLEIMGAEVVEMKHNREKSLCCSAPVATRNGDLATKIANQRISEAEEINADAIACACTGCVFSLSRRSAKKNIETYYITELAQMAIGENPPHRFIEISNRLNAVMAQKIGENPSLITDKHIIKNGTVQRL